jgi:hypothetical protein
MSNGKRLEWLRIVAAVIAWHANSRTARAAISFRSRREKSK